MVIQPNMSPKAIANVWPHTEEIFVNHHISLLDQSLETFVDKKILDTLLHELNAAVGSTSRTCIEGG